MTEQTATITWGVITKLGIDPYEVVLWNVIPRHPYYEKKGILKNRTPTDKELQIGLKHLENFVSLFPDTSVEHPANGGATEFRKQFRAFVERH